MQKRLIIAESGGTKTDWVILQDGQVVERLRTGSFHPQLVTTDEVVNVLSLIPDLLNPNNELIIYSAGCYRDEGKRMLFDKLAIINANVQIKSDLEAAVESTGKRSGWVAILGTGSALVQFNGKDFKLFGGYGWKKGDEGSGFYFGKLIVEAFHSGTDIVDIEYPQRINLMEYLGKPASKQAFSQLSKQLDKAVYAQYHRQNLECFIERYLIPNQVKKISLVGGYISSVIDVVEDIFEMYSIDVEMVISSPIERIIANNS